MRIAFYAPLKAPDHPVPSGDRRVAQLLFEALRRAGHEPFLASRLRSFDGDGDVVRQAQLARRGEAISERMIARWHGSRRDRRPELWFTYHLYYKAPDWLGPAVSRALGIPYVVAEASHAAKRAEGCWATGHDAVERAVRHGDLVIGLNSADRDGIRPLLASADRWLGVPPFLDASAYRPASPAGDREARLVTVAMMRPGDKLASYRVLGAALRRLLDVPWRLEVIGDGPARGEVEAALAPLGDRVRYAGARDENSVAEHLAAADLFVWPAINEAFGMALLEAQASGLAVVVGASGGVGDVVRTGETGIMVSAGNTAEFADAVRVLLLDRAMRTEMGHAARGRVVAEHDLDSAARRLGEAIGRLGRARAA